MSLFKILGHKPWESGGQTDKLEGGDVIAVPAGRLGLWLFLAVVASLLPRFRLLFLWPLTMRRGVNFPANKPSGKRGIPFKSFFPFQKPV